MAEEGKSEHYVWPNHFTIMKMRSPGFDWLAQNLRTQA